jgi:hypothetical protein
MGDEQRFDSGPEGVIVGAGLVNERLARGGITVERRLKDVDDSLPSIGRHD